MTITRAVARALPELRIYDVLLAQSVQIAPERAYQILSRAQRASAVASSGAVVRISTGLTGHVTGA